VPAIDFTPWAWRPLPMKAAGANHEKWWFNAGYAMKNGGLMLVMPWKMVV
jgi:hypothetical protein